MRFSLRLNNDLTVPQYVELAQQAETLDFDQFWVSNDLFLRSAGVILTAMALKTKRINIGSCILNPYTMNAAEIAMLAGTLDEVSDGRFLLGISAGAAEFLGWVGIRHGRPLTATRESVAAIRRLLGNQSAEHAGEFLSWGGEAYMRFPIERQVPIYVGGMGPRMLELAGKIGNGALPLLFPPERYYTARRQVDKGQAHSENPRADFDFATCIWVSASQDRTQARRVLAQKVAYYGNAMNETVLSDLGLAKVDFEPIGRALTEDKCEERAVDLVTDDMLRIGVVGNASQIIERLEPLVADGATHLSFGPPLGPDLGEALNILGQVVQHFKRD
ncbi:MAG: LLM class flavin-dependent oxidoreductase [Chloroflexi bacterium]|nr:LLM class flavin-dependent oxidoreductase [Chloroflexota bacterium]